MSATHDTAAARSRRLTAAAVLVGLEGLAVAACGLFLLGYGLLGHPSSVGEAEFGGVTVLVIAALPLAAVRGLLLARRWSRGPALITQLIALCTGYSMAQVGGTVRIGGVAVMAVGVAVAVLLIHPAASEALGIRRTAA